MRIPKYRRNGDGRAFVEYRKRRYYLGRYDTPASKKRYAKFIDKLAESDDPPTVSASPTITQNAVEYLKHAKTYYSHNGKPTREFFNVKTAVGHLLSMYGRLKSELFGPRMLIKLQGALIRKGYSRNTINSRVRRIKYMFRWLTRNELVPATVYYALLSVDGLRKGRSKAKERPPVGAVPAEIVDATLPFCNRQVAAIIQVQRICGMRPTEACIMRPCDIDMSGDVWLYTPEFHKGTHLGLSLVKAIPKAAQQIIKPFLDRDPSSYLFSPRDALVERHAKAKIQSRKIQPKLKKPRYTVNVYGQSIVYAIKRAAKQEVAIPHWTPNQLRHLSATEMRQRFGEESAQVWLGHSQINTTAIYTEKQRKELLAVAEKVSSQPQ